MSESVRKLVYRIVSASQLTGSAPHSTPTWQKCLALETKGFIESLIAIFQKYAGKDGNKCKLSKTEFLTFMNTELAALRRTRGVLDA